MLSALLKAVSQSGIRLEGFFTRWARSRIHVQAAQSKPVGMAVP